jgi:predicted anti-sigma-YlaC factor YlaD
LEQHCSEEVLSAYLDGDLESEASGTTAEHLAECEVCRQSLAQVRAIRDEASGMEQLVPPERVWGAIQERIHGSRPRRRQLTRLFWVGVPALAAALLVVVLAGGLGERARDTIRSYAHFGHAHAQGMAAAVSELSEGKAAEETARDYGEYVHGIDRAIDECRAAMDENPGNARVRAAYSGASSDRQRAMDRLASGGE